MGGTEILESSVTVRRLINSIKNGKCVNNLAKSKIARTSFVIFLEYVADNMRNEFADYNITISKKNAEYDI
jgi:hypothetical protein